MPSPNGIVVAGRASPIGEQFGTVEISATNGVRRSIRYRGESSSLRAAMDSLITGSSEATYRQDGATATLDVTFKSPDGATGSESQDTAELYFAEKTAPLKFAPGYVGMTSAELNYISIAVDDAHALDKNAANYQTEFGIIETGVSTIAGDAGLAMFRDLVSNPPLDSYSYLAPVVVINSLIAPGSGVTLDLSDVGNVILPASIELFIDTGLLDHWTLPTTANSIGIRDGFTLGWLYTARSTVNADGGILLTEQYTLDAWPDNHYTFV